MSTQPSPESPVVAVTPHPDRPWHDDWLVGLPHGDHHPAEDCLRCHAERIWSAYVGQLAKNVLLDAVAHAAWHLMDESGEMEDDPALHIHSALEAERLSGALDALEASGWEPCDARGQADG